MIDHMGLVPMSAEITMFYSEFTASLSIAKSQERDRIVELAKNRICFDHKDGCEHGVCYGLSEMIALIMGEQK